MSDLPEQASSAAAPLTRRARRVGQGHGQGGSTTAPRKAMVTRPLTVLGTMAFAALVALTGYSSPQLVAVAVALAGFVLAWGWPVLLGLPSPRGTIGVLAAGTVFMAAAVILTPDAPYLRWIPAAMAVAVVVAFLHQLMRRDGRPRLTESIAATTSGLAIIGAGITLAPIPHVLAGESALAAAMAGLGVGVLADPLVVTRRLRQWALFVSMVLGGAAALAVAALAHHPRPAPAALLGLLAAAVSHAGRRILAVLPATVLPRAQLAVASSSSLLVGAVVYLVVRYTVA